MACSGLKMGSFHLFRQPNLSRIILGKPIFDPFLTHYLSQDIPFSRHFGILAEPQRATTRSHRAKNTCFGIPCGSRSFLKKVFFCTWWTLLTQFGTHLFGLPPVACRGPLGLGTGI